MNTETSTRIRAGLNNAAVVELPSTGRKMRTPDHDFHIRHRPFQLVPFMCAPVLPGDTMKNALLQGSALTDPIKNPLIGWWLEHYIFYVPFRAMTDLAAYIETMALDPAFGELNAAGDIAADVLWYHSQAGDPSWAYWATKAVVAEFFRDEGESADPANGTTGLGGYPQVGIMKKRALESMILHSAISNEPDTLPGQYDEDSTLDEDLGSGATNFADHYDAYQALVAQKLADMTYEDYLKSYGVNVPQKPSDNPLPELLRYGKSWTYPSRAVDETDGSIAAACQWRYSLRADKDRFFKEPGIIIGLTAACPKVYFSKQSQAVVDSMKSALDWLPAVLADEAYTSLKKFTSNGTNSGNGPLGFQPSADYWVDLRDLFVNGDQFVNFALTETDAGLVALPTAALSTRFVSSTDVDNLFAAASPLNQVRQDGVCRLSILSRVRDFTP